MMWARLASLWRAVRTASRTLRFRLMAWNAFVVVLTAAATLAALREGVRYALYHEVDQTLKEDLHEIGLMLDDRPLDTANMFDVLNQRAQGHIQHGWFIVFFNEQGDVQWASDRAPRAVRSPQAAAQDNVPVEVENFRFVQRSFARPDVGIAAARVGVSLQPIWADIARVDRQVALAAGLVLLIAPLCGYWLAGRATQPLSEMMQVSARLRPNHLDERLPLRGSGDELDLLAATINRLLDRIAAHLQRRRDMLANAAHELRTPLAAMRSSIEVTLNEPRSASDYQDALTELIEEHEHLETLVNQLLLLSEAEAERGVAPATPLHYWVQRSADMFRGVAEARSVTLHTELEPCLAHIDPEHLRHVINNLLDNAIKFTPAGGRVEATLRAAADPRWLELRVADTGCGIPAEEQSRVFERFYRGAQASAPDAVRGTGLGLSICAAIVAAHDGAIHLESEPGRGAVFTVTLPRVNEDAAPPA